MTTRGRISLTFGSYELDPEALELRREGRLVRLAPQACRLLVALTAAPNEVLSRDQLQRTLWAAATHVDFERGLNSAMRKLRVALNESADSPRYVQTLHGRGYRFVAPVQRVATMERPDADGAAGISSSSTGVVAPTSSGGRRGWSGVRAAVAACVAGVCAVALSFWAAAPPDRARLVVRVDAIRSATASDPSAAAPLVAALQAHIGRIASSKLTIVDLPAHATHELVVTAYEGGAPRLSLRLLDRRVKEQLWARVVDSSDASVEHEAVIAAGRAIADRLLHADPEARLVAATTSDGALAAYRQGERLFGVRLSELSRAIEWFKEAVRIDSDFAPAWAALARAHATLAMLDGRDAPELQLARTAASRALASDTELADAHIALGQVRLALDNDPAGAEIDLRRAGALGSDAGQHQLWLAWALNAEGQNAEGLRVLDEALSREPRNAMFHAWRGLLLHAVRRYDDEIVELRRAASLDESSWLAALHLGLGYSRRREYDLAIPALRRAVALSDAGGVSLSWLGRVAADAGDVATAADALRQLRDIGRARGLAPSLAASVEYHLANHRQKSTASQGRTS
jgi:DNA-binding winged helix-turn-helix (wHTH) protein/tetratricopeptide (TPR) repeat protein